mgnify:CR=1 FL=1
MAADKKLRESHFPAIEKKHGEPMAHWHRVMKTIADLKYPEQIAFLRENHGFSQAHANALVMYARGSVSSKKFSSPEDFFATLDPAVARNVKLIFSTITKKHPDLELVTAWNQPMLKLDGQYIFGVCVLKNHILIAPWGGVLDEFRPRLTDYKVNKKTIQVPVDWKPDATLLRDMVAARLAQDEAWVNKPKPKVQYQPREFREEEMIDRSRQCHDLVHLALQTDSTRVINLYVFSNGPVKLEGVNIGHHDASHHGQDAARIEQLAKIEEAEFRVFNEFLTKLQRSSEGNETLLDRTMVLHASNLGNASAHSTQNLPIIVAGGGFKHAGHVAYDHKNNRPLSNLYVRMLHQMGIEADKFGTSTGVINDIG